MAKNVAASVEARKGMTFRNKRLRNDTECVIIKVSRKNNEIHFKREVEHYNVKIVSLEDFDNKVFGEWLEDRATRRAALWEAQRVVEIEQKKAAEAALRENIRLAAISGDMEAFDKALEDFREDVENKAVEEYKEGQHDHNSRFYDWDFSESFSDVYGY